MLHCSPFKALAVRANTNWSPGVVLDVCALAHTVRDPRVEPVAEECWRAKNRSRVAIADERKATII